MSERLQSPVGPGAGIRGPVDFAAIVAPFAISIFSFWAAWSATGATSPTTSFISLGVLMLACAGALGALHMRVLNAQDYFGGLAMVAIAVFALWASSNLAGMRGFSFGPGTAPRLFATMLGGFGVLIVLLALYIQGPGFPKYFARGPLLVTASVVLFALMIRPVGLVISSFVMFVFAASGSKETKWIEALIAAAVLTAFCVGLFVYLLNLPFQMWPRFTLGPLRIGY
jgi:putative tricarboxylic transport membrane protein